MSLLDGLARYLAGVGVGTFDVSGAIEAADWSIFSEGLPPQPDKVISLYRYAQSESDSRNPWDEISVQARIRGTADPRDSGDRAQSVYNALHGLGSITLPDGTWLQLAIGTQGGPVAIGVDQVGRHEHTVNFRVEYDNPSALRPA